MQTTVHVDLARQSMKGTAGQGRREVAISIGSTAASRYVPALH